jgi:hypothetical protein
MYKKIEEMYLNDPEFTPEIVYTLTENVYRQELLVLFKLTEFNQEEVNRLVLELYEAMKENETVQQVLATMEYEEIISFMLLFSYDYFYLFYPFLKGEESPLFPKMSPSPTHSF